MLEQSKCFVTHPQLASGNCPHCGELVIGDPTGPEAGVKTADVRWNTVRLLEDLDRDDEASRVTTIFNLSDHIPPLAETLPVLRKAFDDRAQSVRDRALTISVRLISRTDDRILVETCGSLLRKDPSDLGALHVLLHFYCTAQYRSESYRTSRNTLILQLIECMPDVPQSAAIPMKLDPHEDGDVFDQAKALWLNQVDTHPEDVRILGNASIFFQAVDDVMAGKLLRKCKELEPGNSRWSLQLGQLYSHQGDPEQPESHVDWGLMSLVELETAWKSGSDSDHRFCALMQLPRVALQANEIEKACRYAEELLSAASNLQHLGMQIMGDREANTILGWHALRNDNFDEAKARLFSARTPVGPYLTSCFCFMDPLLKLVGWMLYRDQRQAVLEYLRREQALVPEFRGRLMKWASDIEQGVTPDFQDRALLSENLKAAKQFGTKSAD
jgi:hypothetical protein